MEVEMSYTNFNGLTFASKKQMMDKVYRKNCKYWVGTYSGVGLDYELWKEIETSGKKGIVFVCKNALHDFYEERKRNRTVIALEVGEYFISIEDMQKYGKVSTLRERDGKQIFIPAFRLTKLED
jgi:hypothetical protein